MTKITTHILDLTHGCPAAFVKVDFYHIQSESKRIKMAHGTTNEDGRLATPLFSSEAFESGDYELLFHIGEYYKKQEVQTTNPPFLNQVSVRVGLSSEQEHYHVPLLVSPWGYQIYRGS
jgi:5-hydroxyisourate hydrolase